MLSRTTEFGVFRYSLEDYKEDILTPLPDQRWNDQIEEIIDLYTIRTSYLNDYCLFSNGAGNFLSEYKYYEAAVESYLWSLNKEDDLNPQTTPFYAENLINALYDFVEMLGIPPQISRTEQDWLESHILDVVKAKNYIRHFWEDLLERKGNEAFLETGGDYSKIVWKKDEARQTRLFSRAYKKSEDILRIIGLF